MLEIGYKSAVLYFISLALLILGGWITITGAKLHDDFVEQKRINGKPFLKKKRTADLILWAGVIIICIGFAVMGWAKHMIGES